LRTANKSMRRDKPKHHGSAHAKKHDILCLQRLPAVYAQTTAHNQRPILVKDQDHPDNQHKTCQSTECQKPYSHCQRSKNMDTRIISAHPPKALANGKT